VLWHRLIPSLTIVENERPALAERTEEALKSVGTIAVKLQFTRNVRSIQYGNKMIGNRVFGQIPQKALKGDSKSHQTRQVQAFWPHNTADTLT
jgi:hypothetical protein